jgi:hypothetical protein
VAFDRGISVFHLLGLAEPAAVLAGVVLRGPLALLSILPPAERDDRAVLLDHVRELIGGDSYERSLTRGAAMSDDDVVAYALEQLDIAESMNPAPAALHRLDVSHQAGGRLA